MSELNEDEIKRPLLSDYLTGVPLRNLGYATEEYRLAMENYIDYLEAKFNNVDLSIVIKRKESQQRCPHCNEPTTYLNYKMHLYMNCVL